MFWVQASDDGTSTVDEEIITVVTVALSYPGSDSLCHCRCDSFSPVQLMFILLGSNIWPVGRSGRRRAPWDGDERRRAASGRDAGKWRDE